MKIIVFLSLLVCCSFSLSAKQCEIYPLFGWNHDILPLVEIVNVAVTGQTQDLNKKNGYFVYYSNSKRRIEFEDSNCSIKSDLTDFTKLTDGCFIYISGYNETFSEIKQCKCVFHAGTITKQFYCGAR